MHQRGHNARHQLQERFTSGDAQEDSAQCRNANGCTGRTVVGHEPQLIVRLLRRQGGYKLGTGACVVFD